MKSRIQFLLLLCCVLLVPVTYALTASATQQGNPKLARVKKQIVQWLPTTNGPEAPRDRNR